MSKDIPDSVRIVDFVKVLGRDSVHDELKPDAVCTIHDVDKFVDGVLMKGGSPPRPLLDRDVRISETGRIDDLNPNTTFQIELVQFWFLSTALRCAAGLGSPTAK